MLDNTDKKTWLIDIPPRKITCSQKTLKHLQVPLKMIEIQVKSHQPACQVNSCVEEHLQSLVWC